MTRARHLAAAHAARARTSRGVAAIEFVMVFPLFFTLLYGIVTFSLIFVAEQNLTLAAEEGARAALNYQQASSVAAALSARTAAACSAASNMVASIVSSAHCVANATSCSYNSAMDCVNVTLTYDYAATPLVPTLPLMKFVVPATLASSATVQLNPENLL